MTPAPLPDPRTAAGRAALAALLAEPARVLLAVDYDGTLAPIVARPDDARPAEGAVDALTAVATLMLACAVVTGRAATEAVRLGGLEQVPGLEVLGHYGLQRWRAGHLDSPAPDPAVDRARRRLPDLLAGAPDGVHLEDKEHSLVVHTRPAEDPAGALEAVTPLLTTLATELGLETVPGRYVVELRPPGVDKGSAVRRLVDEHDPAVVVYLGDDLGDLPAFDAVEAARDGRLGLTVASAEPAQPDAPRALVERADLVVPGPAGVVTLLRAIAAAVGVG